MSENCLICKTELTTKPEHPDEGQPYECPRCGKYLMSINTEEVIQRRSYNEEEVAILSHAIRKMQKQYPLPMIYPDLVTAILKNPLPSLAEQENNFIRWLAENMEHGEEVLIEASTHQAIMGAKTPKGFAFIIKHLFDTGILAGQTYLDGVGRAHVSLTFDGWEYYRELERGSTDSRKAFMAMEYGNMELDKIVEDHFKQAVADTGFELYRLDEKPKAGLIDDRLRVEIRNSRFLISDLTHENSGSYWEAGYAEGLGKPVIYTCNKEKFDKDKSHFDTNHHLTIKWDADDIEDAIKSLKATIRATLPDEAKLSDD